MRSVLNLISASRSPNAGRNKLSWCPLWRPWSLPRRRPPNDGASFRFHLGARKGRQRGVLFTLKMRSSAAGRPQPLLTIRLSRCPAPPRCFFHLYTHALAVQVFDFLATFPKKGKVAALQNDVVAFAIGGKGMIELLSDDPHVEYKGVHKMVWAKLRGRYGCKDVPEGEGE